MKLKSVVLLSGLSLAFTCQVPGQTASDRVAIALTVVAPQRPALGSLFIASSQNNWDPGTDSLKHTEGGLYTIVLHIPRGTRLEYKYTRGSWESVETDSEYVDIPNRMLVCDVPRAIKDSIMSWRDDLIDSTCINQEIPDCPITLNKAIEDARFFFRILEETHPQLLATIAPEDYVKLKRHTIDTLVSLQRNNGLRRYQLCRLLAAAAAAIGDAHTGLGNPSAMINALDSTSLAPPFTLRFERGKVLIDGTSDTYHGIENTEILTVNGVDFASFIRPVLRLISAETESQRLNWFIGGQAIYWRILRVSGPDNFTATIRDTSGSIRRVDLRPISFLSFDQLMSRGRAISQESRFQFYDQGNTCYFAYNSFDYSRAGMHLIDSLFSTIKARGAKNLIIDLRYNGGGNSSMGDYMLNYLTSKPYCQVSKTDIKLSEYSIKRRYRAFMPLRGLVVTRRSELETPKNLGFKFDGRLFLLTGPLTFSSAALFTHTVKDFHIGTIIGEETGGLRESFGDVLAFYTPNYGVFFLCSYKKFYAPVPSSADRLHGTQPDITIDNAALSRFQQSKDPALMFLLDYIRSR